MFRHVGHNLVIRRQGRGGFSSSVAVSGVGIVHILVQKIASIILGSGDTSSDFFAGRFIAGHQPVFVPPPGDNLPDQRLGSGIGVVHRGHAELLWRPCRKAIHADEHEQVPLFL